MDNNLPLTLVAKSTLYSIMTYAVGTRCFIRVTEHFFAPFPPHSTNMGIDMCGHICQELLNEPCLHNVVSTRGMLHVFSGDTIHWDWTWRFIYLGLKIILDLVKYLTWKVKKKKHTQKNWFWPLGNISGFKIVTISLRFY